MRGIEDRWNPLLGFWHLGGDEQLPIACLPPNKSAQNTVASHNTCDLPGDTGRKEEAGERGGSGRRLSSRDGQAAVF